MTPVERLAHIVDGGREAARLGRCPSDCGLLPGTREHAAWVYGWFSVARRTVPANIGRAWERALDAARRETSNLRERAARQAPELPPPQPGDGPEHPPCTACGGPVSRREGERSSAWLDRKTCSKACHRRQCSQGGRTCAAQRAAHPMPVCRRKGCGAPCQRRDAAYCCARCRAIAEGRAPATPQRSPLSAEMLGRMRVAVAKGFTEREMVTCCGFTADHVRIVMAAQMGRLRL